MTIDQKKARISDALVAHKGLDHIIDVAADVMGNPMFILDTSMKAISRSKPAPELAELWETLEDSNNDRLLISRTVEQAGIYDHLMHNDTPIYGEFSFCPCRMLGCRIRDKVQAIAYICMFEVNPITPEDEELLVYLCKIIYHEMLYTGETAMQRNPVFSIVCDLLEGNIGYQEYLNRSSYANLRIPKNFACWYWTTTKTKSDCPSIIFTGFFPRG